MPEANWLGNGFMHSRDDNIRSNTHIQLTRHANTGTFAFTTLMTAQIHERLILDGENTTMAFCPPFPEDHPRIIDRHAEGLPGDGADAGCYSTACWREYQGTWEIEDGKFYLRRLVGRFRLRSNEPIFADWFSGMLRIPRGECLQYVHMGFGSIFEEELHIKIEKGVVTSSKVIDNRGMQADRRDLALRNLPGSENRFPGDDE